MKANIMPITKADTIAQTDRDSVQSVLKTLILATGETQPCRKAAAFAKALAQRYGTQIIVAEAVPSYPMDQLKAERSVRQALVALRRWTECNGLDPYVTERIVVRDEPNEGLARALSIEPANIVLMGSHASKGFERLLLGSVAEELARQSDVASLIVGPKCGGDFDVYAQFRTVLFASDLSDTSFAPFTLLKNLQASFGTKVFAVHAFRAAGADAAERYSLRMAAADRIKADLAGISLMGIAAEEGHPAAVIRRFAESLKADAIVLGLRRGGEYTRAATHLRSLTSKIIAVASCPIFTVATNREKH